MNRDGSIGGIRDRNVDFVRLGRCRGLIFSFTQPPKPDFERWGREIRGGICQWQIAVAAEEAELRSCGGLGGIC